MPGPSGTFSCFAGGGSEPAVIWDSPGHAYTTHGAGPAWAHLALDQGVSKPIDASWLVQDENHGIVQFDNLRFDTVKLVQASVMNGYVLVSPVS